MSSINLMGAYSGIDMSVIDQLIEAEKAKGVKFTNKKQNIEREKNAWKDVNTRLDSLYKKLETLTKAETFDSRTVTSNVKDSNSLSVTAGENAAIGEYRVQVQQLATSTRLAGGRIDVESIDTELNIEGNFAFKVDDQAEFYTVEIASTDSLKDIIGKINLQTEESGIQATIVDNRLVLTNTEMGSSTITIGSLETIGDEEVFTENILDNSVADQLGFGSTDEVISEIGQSAIFEINGLKVQRNTNTITDAVEGLTFKLSNEHLGSDNEIISVASDTEKTVDAVKSFVEQYNSVIKFLDEQMAVGDPSAEGNTTGALTGDGTIMRLQSGLRSLMTRNLTGDFSGDFKNVEDIGITLDRYGVASFDEEVFNQAMQDDAANVARFFYEPKMSTEVLGTDGEVLEPSVEQEGLSELLNNLIDTYISSSTGIISTKNESYDRMLKDINKQIETFNERIDRKRDRYIQQFTALDIAMMQAQSQMDYLYSQIGMGQAQNS